EARVERALLEELRMCADRGDAATFHDDDPVGLADGREAVRDDDRRAVLHQPLERLLHGALAFRIERARRLVEQQDRRVLEERAGDRDALALAAREPHAALAEERVVALRQRANEPRGGRRARRRLDLLRARGPPAVTNGPAPRRAEEHGVLRHEPDAAPYVGRIDLHDVNAVDQDAPRARIVETKEQLERRALACAGWPDERDRLAGRDLEREVIEGRDLLPRRIAK